MDKSCEEISKNDFMDGFLAKLFEVPGMKVSKREFLTSVLMKYTEDTEQLVQAINTSPIESGIEKKVVDRVAKSIISEGVLKTSAISFAAGIPGGPAMFATIPADTLQFYSNSLIIAQKLAYIYGFNELWGNEKDFEETKSTLMLFLGTMFGVSGSTVTLKVVTANMANMALKELPKRALTKTLYYPVIKKIAKYVGVKITKDSFGKGVAKVIPVLGGLVSGGITFASLSKMSEKLRTALSQGISREYIENEYIRDVEFIEKESTSNSFDSAENEVAAGSTKKEKQDNREFETLDDKLDKIKSLLENGILTEDEFNTLKMNLIKESMGL